MKKPIYVIRLSEDGLYSEYFTTPGKLFKEIKKIGGGYKPTSIWRMDGELSFTLQNLLKLIQEAETSYWVATVSCLRGTIEINRLTAN